MFQKLRCPFGNYRDINVGVAEIRMQEIKKDITGVDVIKWGHNSEINSHKFQLIEFKFPLKHLPSIFVLYSIFYTIK